MDEGRAQPGLGDERERPNPARIYDYALGGHANFAADRAAFEAFAAVYPDSVAAVRSNRAFLHRAVAYLARQGIDQFLDIGAGLPTAGNVHEIARRINPQARVVYVDNDPVAVRFSRILLSEDGISGVSAIEADLRDPASILAHPWARRLLDWTRPVGVLLVAVLPFIGADDVAERAVREIVAALPSGSYIALAHATMDGASDAFARFVQRYEETTHPLGLRPRAVIERFFAGLELVEPGLVSAPAWRPAGSEDPLGLDDPLRTAPERVPNWAGVGRKP